MSNTDNLTTSLLFVLGLNLLMFIVGSGIADVGGVSPYDSSDNLLTKYDAGNYTFNSSIDSFMPSTQSVGVDPESNNVFTDIFTSARNWVLDKTGIGFLLGILSAPSNILITIGLSPALAWALTAIWYGVNVLFLVAFVLGR